MKLTNAETNLLAETILICVDLREEGADKKEIESFVLSVVGLDLSDPCQGSLVTTKVVRELGFHGVSSPVEFAIDTEMDKEITPTMQVVFCPKTLVARVSPFLGEDTMALVDGLEYRFLADTTDMRGTLELLSGIATKLESLALGYTEVERFGQIVGKIADPYLEKEVVRRISDMRKVDSTMYY